MKGGFGSGLQEAIAFRLGLPGPRRWADDRRSSSLGVASACLVAVVLAVTLGPAIEHAPPTLWIPVLLGVGLIWTAMRAIVYRSAGITNQLLLDSGIAVLAVALMGPVPAVVFWIIAVTVSELLQRPWLSVAVLNVAVTCVAISAAGGVYTLGMWLIDGSAPSAGGSGWPQGELLHSVVLAVAVACTYSLLESVFTEVVSLWLTQAYDESISWRSIVASQALGLGLGSTIGLALSFTDPRMALLAVALPFVLAVELVRQMHSAAVGRASKRAMVQAQIRIATADHVHTVVDLVVQAVPSITCAVWVSAFEGPPSEADLADPNVQLFRLSPEPRRHHNSAEWGKQTRSLTRTEPRPYSDRLAKKDSARTRRAATYRATSGPGHRVPCWDSAVRDTAPRALSGGNPAIQPVLPPPPSEWWLRTQMMPFEMCMRPFEEEDVRGLVQTASAAVGRIEDEIRVHWWADHDTLTGLLNRGGLQRASRAGLSFEDGVSALLIDLDGFKAVNDTYGHDRGDQLLIDCARSLVEAVGHHAVVSRWGGDEFVAVLPGERHSTELSVIGEELIDAVQRAGQATSPTVRVSASVGHAAQAPCDAHDGATGEPLDIADLLEELIYRADTALYTAKRSGRSMVRGA